MDSLSDLSKDSERHSLTYTKGSAEEVVTFDIDDTLIIWGLRGEPDVSFIDPDHGTTESGIAHKEHVERVKRHFNEGHFVIAWSAGGGEYARRAIEALGLTDYVHISISKPMQYYDDLDAHMFMGRRTYLNDQPYFTKGEDNSYKPRTDFVGEYSDKY